MGLVNTQEMLQKALRGNYAVGAFNVNNMEILQAVVRAATDLSSPVILQVSSGARKYAGDIFLRKLVEAAVENSNIPIALHLDHGKSFEICKNCIDSGFTSVMIDGSSLEYNKNIERTCEVVEYAHKHNVSVEAELGCLAGIENDILVPDSKSFYTDPEQAVDFVKKTGIDSLAIAIGTSHGAYKFKFGQNFKLRLDILEKIQQELPFLPIVLHGASSVIQKYVHEINSHGGNLENAIGIPEEELRTVAKMSVCKINIDSDLRLAMTACIRKYLHENPKDFDPRKYLGIGRNEIYELVKHKIKYVLGSEFKVK